MQERFLGERFAPSSMNFLAMTHGHAAGQKPGRIDRIGLSGVRAQRFGVLGFGGWGGAGFKIVGLRVYWFRVSQACRQRNLDYYS